MITLNQLRQIVRQGESQNLEFKLKMAHPEKIMKEVVAFANASGGLLLVGVDDKHGIIGLDNIEEEAYVLERAIEKYCFPALEYQIEYVFISDELAILACTVAESQIKPHIVIENFDDKTGRTYLRINDRSIQASRELRQILKEKHKDKTLPKNRRFGFGEKEKILMVYLEKNKTITVSSFAVLAGIDLRLASRTLVLLVLSGVLEIEPGQGEDSFFLRPEAAKIKL